MSICLKIRLRPLENIMLWLADELMNQQYSIFESTEPPCQSGLMERHNDHVRTFFLYHAGVYWLKSMAIK